MKMRKLYFFALMVISLFLLHSLGCMAQGSKSTLLNEGFEGATFPPDDWTTIFIDGYNEWSSYEEGANSSSFSASVGYGSSTQENWLITPQLMPSVTDNQLTFWIKTAGAYPTIYFYTRVSTTDNQIESFGDTLLTLANYYKNLETYEDSIEITDTWTQYTVDLSSYADQAIYIAFQVVGGGSKVCIDDIAGIPFAEFSNDLRVKSVLLPSSTDFKYTGDDVDVSAVIKNVGVLAQTGITVDFKVNGVSYGTKTLTIASGDVDTISVPWPAQVGEHTISVEVPSDDNNINNTQSNNIVIYPKGSLVESFEGDVFPPSNWTNEDGKWEVQTFNYYNGSYCAGTFSPNYKLITPRLIIADGDSLSFYGFAYEGNNFSVLSSSDLVTWDTLGNFSGTSLEENYKIYFNSTTNASSIGNRYIAFVATSEWGSLYLDMVSGPQVYPVTDDFEILSFDVDNSADFPKAESPVNFKVVVRNNTATSQSKVVSLKNAETLLASGTSKELGQSETDTLTIAWTPDQGYPTVSVTAELPEDDAVGNNKSSVTTHVYPKDPLEASISQSFESSSSLPDYWFADDVNSATWIIASGTVYSPSCTAHSGNAMLDFQCYASTDNVKLTSPWLSLPYNKYKVSFWLYRDATSWSSDQADLVNVRVNSQPDITGSVLAGTVNRSTTLEPTVTDEGWYHYSFIADCSNLTSGFVILEGVSTGSYSNIYIDDLSIEGIPPYDAAITNIVEPADSIWGYQSVNKDIKVILKNTGENSLTSATIHWSVNNTPQSDYSWTGSLLYNESDTITLANYTFETDNTYSIVASVEAENDNVSSNDTAQINVKVKPAVTLPYANGFEDAVNPINDWLVKDVDGDGFTWEIGDVSPKFGLKYIRSASYDDNTSEALTPDNWLITPGIYLAHSKAYLSYYVGASDDDYFAENYSVLISETGTDTADFATVLHTETLTEKAYKQVTLELDGYQGKTVFIAFRHFNCTNNYYLNIDSVSLYYPTVYTVSLSASPTEGGTVSDDVEFIDGESVTVTATANSGYAFVNWTENGTEVSTNAEYTYVPTSENHALVANFSKVTYTITATAGENGSISPSGAVTVDYDATQAFAISANTGYKVADVLVDGTSVGARETYTFNNVIANHTISASFEVLTYDVTFTVLHGTNPVSDATISIDGQTSLTSDASGLATISLENGTYGYTVSANGYDAYSGTFTVADENSSVSVNLTATGIGNNGLYNLSLYPNPFDSFVKVNNAGNVSVIIISDIIGNEIKRVVVNGNESLTITLNIPSGTYLFTFIDNSGKHITKKLVKK